MGTKNDPGQFDCYANAAPDEPMFILLGRDRHAATLVRLWALLRTREGEDAEKVAEALRCATSMDVWRGRLGKPHIDAAIEQTLLFAITEGMSEHPEGFEEVCDCNLCRSYA